MCFGFFFFFFQDSLQTQTGDTIKKKGFPGGSDGKESACNGGVPGMIPGSGRSHGEGNGNLLQYSCLESSMDRGARLATVNGVAKSQTRMSDLTLNLEKNHL